MTTIPLSGRCRAACAMGKATVVEHLDELRSRLIVSGLAVVLCTIVAFAFQHQILA